MLGAYSNKENENQLKSFENNNSEDTKFMIVMNKANEGLHIKGIDGIVWFRALDENSKILYLQQLGRAIYSEDPNNPTPDEKRPLVIDLANNTLNVNIDKDIKNNTRRSDLELLSLVVDWVKLHNGLPNIDSTNKIEQRYAATLYRIQNEYMKYTNGFEKFPNLDKEKKEEIRDILEKGAEIDLWDLELPPKTIQYAEKILEVNDFEVTGVMRDFVELENETNGISNRNTALENALEIEEWCKENYGEKKIWEKKLPSRTSKDKYEKELAIKLKTLRKKIKKYEGIELGKIQNEEDRQIVEIIRKLDKGYGLGDTLKNALEIEEWCKKIYGEKKIWKKYLPSRTSKDRYEKELAIKLNYIRSKIKQYERIELEQIENEEDRQIVEIIRRMDKEYGLGDSLKNALEIEEWCKEKYGEEKIWERKLPSAVSKENHEKTLGIKLRNLRRKIKQYEGVNLEIIQNEEDRQIVEIIRRLDEKYGLGDSLKNALEIEEWCKKNYEEKKIWERKLPSKTSKEKYEKKLSIKLESIRKNIIKKYDGIELEQIENEEDRQIVEVIRELDRKYGVRGALKNALEIEEWCKEKNEEKKKCEMKLPSSRAKDKYENVLGKKLVRIRQKIMKKYEGIELEQIEDEEDRQIVEIIRRLDREYNYRKLKGKDLAKAGFKTGITDVKLCDEEDKALQQLVEQTKEGEINVDEQS